MNATQFRAFCANNSLEFCEAGRDWHDAQVNLAYVGAVIDSEEAMQSAVELLNTEAAYLTIAEQAHGQAWWQHSGWPRLLAGDSLSAKKAMADAFAGFLWRKDSVSYYSEDDILQRNNRLKQSPEETDEDDGLILPPSHVNEPGYWDDFGGLLLADSDLETGVWSCQYDNWVWKLLLILKPDRE